MSHVGVHDSPERRTDVQLPTSPLAMGAEASHFDSFTTREWSDIVFTARLIVHVSDK